MTSVASSTASLLSSKTKSLHDFHLAPVLKSQLHKAFLHLLPLVIDAQFLAALKKGWGGMDEWVWGWESGVGESAMCGIRRVKGGCG